MGLHDRDDQRVTHEQLVLLADQGRGLDKKWSDCGDLDSQERNSRDGLDMHVQLGDLGVMYSHRERSLLLTGSGRKSRRLQDAEFVPLGDPLEELGIALPLEQPGRPFGPA